MESKGVCLGCIAVRTTCGLAGRNAQTHCLVQRSTARDFATLSDKRKSWLRINRTPHLGESI